MLKMESLSNVARGITENIKRITKRPLYKPSVASIATSISKACPCQGILCFRTTCQKPEYPEPRIGPGPSGACPEAYRQCGKRWKRIKAHGPQHGRKRGHCGQPEGMDLIAPEGAGAVHEAQMEIDKEQGQHEPRCQFHPAKDGLAFFERPRHKSLPATCESRSGLRPFWPRQLSPECTISEALWACAGSRMETCTCICPTTRLP